MKRLRAVARIQTAPRGKEAGIYNPDATMTTAWNKPKPESMLKKPKELKHLDNSCFQRSNIVINNSNCREPNIPQIDCHKNACPLALL